MDATYTLEQALGIDDEAPSRRTSIRSTTARGSELTLTEAPFKAGDATARRPSINTSVRCEPSPRRLIVELPWALPVPDSGSSEPTLLSVLRRNTSLMDCSPVAWIASQVELRAAA